MKFIAKGESLVLWENSLMFVNIQDNLFYNFSTGGDTKKITKDLYLKTKFGLNYECVQDLFYADLKLCSGNVDVKTGHTAACYYQENIIRIFSDNNKKCKIFDTNIYPFGIYDVKINNDNLWIVYPTDNMIKKYSISKKEKLKEYTEINGLNYPESIFIDNDTVYISNMGNKSVLKIDKHDNITQFLKFEEPVWEYIKFGKSDCVRLSSGIYIL